MGCSCHKRILRLCSIRHFLLRDLRFLIELRLRKALPADVVLHVIGAAVGRRRQEADLGDDDLGAIPALAGLPVVPGARPQRALDIEPRPLANVVAQDLAVPLEADQIVPLGVLLPVAVDIPVAFAGGERQVDDCARAQDVDRRVLAGAAQKNDLVDALVPLLLSFSLVVAVDRIERLSPVDLDVLAIGIAVELSGHRVDVQIAPRQAVLVEHDVAGLAHEHEVFAELGRHRVLKRPPVGLAHFDGALHSSPPLFEAGATAMCVCLHPRQATAPVILRIASSKRSGRSSTSPAAV